VEAKPKPLQAKLKSVLCSRPAALLAGLLLGLLAWAVLGRSGKHAPRNRKPYEYVYLDSGRVDSYLGELDEGNVRSLSRSETETSSAGVGFQLDTIGSATATQGKQLTVSAVVNKTEADNFYSLLEQLRSGSLATVSAGARDLSQELSPKLVPDGTMVRIENAFVQLPTYLSAYPPLRYASFEPLAPAFEPPPLSQYHLSRYTSGPAAERARISFIKRIGANPRLPFILKIEQPAMTVVIPARFAYLTGDPSLLSARLTIVGKVAVNTYDGFGDGASEDTYLPALLGAPPKLLRELGVREAALHSKQKLFEGLSQSLTFGGRVVEVVPVAMYD
jgi:hypothetical protein